MRKTFAPHFVVRSFVRMASREYNRHNRQDGLGRKMIKRKMAVVGLVGVVGVGALAACGSEPAAQQSEPAQSNSTESPSREAGVTTKDIRVTIVNEYPRDGGIFVNTKDGYGKSSQNLGRGKTTVAKGDEPKIEVSIPHGPGDEFIAKNWPFQKPWFEYDLGDFDKGKEARLGEGESKEWTSPKSGITYTMSRQDDSSGLIQMKLVFSKK